MYAIVDLETTGTHPERDRIIEVAIFVHNGERVIEHFSSLVNPQTYIKPFISAFTGITNEMVSTAPLFEEIIDEVDKLTDGRIFVAHNVRFDYSFLRAEFNRLERKFHRRQLCSVRLSRKLLPGKPSYSLGKLCKNLGILLEDRHRAYGDAAATAHLFDLLLKNDKEQIIANSIKDELKSANLPPELDREEVDQLPDDMGVYYFLDYKGRVLYIGKSNYIRRRVLSHFTGDLKSKRYQNMKPLIHHIGYERTGNQLIALLHESQEIKRFMPNFNSAQKKRKYRFGLFEKINDEGFKVLQVRIIGVGGKPLRLFRSKRGGLIFLQELIGKHDLCYGLHPELPNPFGCNKIDLGSCVGDCPACISKQAYNKKIDKVVKSLGFDHDNFILIGEGRSNTEKAFVMVENQEFMGYGFFDEDSGFNHPEELKSHLIQMENHQDYRAIIKSELKKRSKYKLLPYKLMEVS